MRVGRYADTDGTFAIDTHDGAWRVHVSFLYDGDVTQFYLSGAGGDYLVPDVVHRGIHTVGYYAQLLFAGADFSGVDNLVLRLQQACQLFGIDTHACQLVHRDEYIHHLGLCAEQCDFHHPVGSDHLCLDAFGPVPHFFVAESVVGCQAVVDTEYVTEVVRYCGYRSSAWQLGLYVEHFAPQFVPFLGDGGSR